VQFVNQVRCVTVLCGVNVLFYESVHFVTFSQVFGHALRHFEGFFKIIPFEEFFIQYLLTVHESLRDIKELLKLQKSILNRNFEHMLLLLDRKEFESYFYVLLKLLHFVNHENAIFGVRDVVK